LKLKNKYLNQCIILPLLKSKIMYYLPSPAIDSVESKGLPPWLVLIDSNFWPNDKCLIVWVVLNDEDENGCTSWTKI